MTSTAVRPTQQDQDGLLEDSSPSELERPPRRRLFVSYCWGAAGSTWLARALNAHPDIFAMHRPGFDGEDPHELDELFDRIKSVFSSRSVGGAYPVVGVTHGVALGAHDALSDTYGKRYAPFTVVRHPILRVESHRALLAKTDRSRRPERDVFRQSVGALNRVTAEVATGIPIHRIEDLANRIDPFQALVDYISDSRLRVDGRQLRRLQQARIGRHQQRDEQSHEVFESWPTRWRRDFLKLLDLEAAQIYTELGYVTPSR